MPYDIELIRKNQLQASKWSGGTTTQLAIFPKEAIYSEGNFKWRLSSAKVEVEESTFTSLPNINRVIMIIEGRMILEHEGHHKSILEPFDQDRFSGSWRTKSYGKVTDFNLMMGKDCEGELEHLYLEKGQSKIISFDNNQQFYQNVQGVYCVNGQVKIEISSHLDIILYEGDIILLTPPKDIEDLSFRVFNEEEIKADLIRVSIHY